jgi:hypothetical protein
MPRDHFVAGTDYHLMHIAFDQHLAMTIGSRHRVVVVAIANQGQRGYSRGALLARLIANGRQGQQRFRVLLKAFANRLVVSAQPPFTPLPALLNELRVQLLPV